MNQNQLIYWEQQGYDQLCGVHCINSLLQGPFFTEVDLAQIAQELDKKESELLGFQKNQFNHKSQNVAEDGNFSIQVLSEALKKLGDIYIESVDSKINQNQDLSGENGFICNSSAHWFSIRKIANVWYNLNSTNTRGPEIISDFYLSAFLLSVKENGYAIFVVRGELPQYVLTDFEQNKRQKVYTQEKIRARHERRIKKKDYKLNIGGQDDIELEKAIKASKQQNQQQQKKGANDDSFENFQNTSDEDESTFSKQINDQKSQSENQQFIGQGIQFQKQNVLTNYDKFNIDPMDAEYRSIILMTLEQKFSEQLQEGLEVLFQLPDGKGIKNVFNYDATIEDLYDFVFFSIREKPYQFSLFYPIEKLELVNVNQLILDVGIDTMTQLIVRRQ